MPTAQERRRQARETVAAAHRERFTLAATQGGRDLRNAVKTHWQGATFTSWAEAVEQLREGIRIPECVRATAR